MLRFSFQTRADQPTETQLSGLLHHPTQEILIAYRFANLTAPGVVQTFLTYCQDQLDHEFVNSTLEMHQLLDLWTRTAQRMDVDCSLVGVGQIETQMVLAAFRGAIVLKRGAKVGRILHAEDSLELVEGKVQADDVYVLFAQNDEKEQALLQKHLPEVSASEAVFLLDDSEVQAGLVESLAGNGGSVTIALLQEKDATQERDAHQQLSASEGVGVGTAAVGNVEAQQPSPAQKATHALRAVKKTGTHAFSFITNIAQMIQVEFNQLWSNDVYVRRRTRKSLGYVSIFAVVLIFSAIGTFAFFRSRQTQQQQEVVRTLQPFQARRAEIEAEVSDNPVDARQKAEQLIADLDISTKTADQPAYVTTALAAELDKTQQFYTSISGQTEFPVLPTFFDLRLVQSNFLASSVDISTNTLFFLDGGQRKILALNIEKKQPTLLPIGEYPDLHAMIVDEKYLYFLGQGLFRFTLSGSEVAKLVENQDDTITTGDSLGVFGSYVYVMNKSKNNIFRYTTNDDQLSSTPVAWVQPSQGTDFSTAQNFSIDGDIWVGTQTGELKKFSLGKVADFTVTGLKDPFASAITVFTKPDLDNLYVLEPQKSRMVVLNKKGEFLKEVKSSTLAASTSVVASETLKKVFALSGSLVFEMEL